MLPSDLRLPWIASFRAFRLLAAWYHVTSVASSYASGKLSSRSHRLEARTKNRCRGWKKPAKRRRWSLKQVAINLGPATVPSQLPVETLSFILRRAWRLAQRQSYPLMVGEIATPDTWTLVRIYVAWHGLSASSLCLLLPPSPSLFLQRASRS